MCNYLLNLNVSVCCWYVLDRLTINDMLMIGWYFKNPFGLYERNWKDDIDLVLSLLSIGFAGIYVLISRSSVYLAFLLRSCEIVVILKHWALDI